MLPETRIFQWLSQPNPNGNGNPRLQGCERGGTPRRRGATASQSASSDVTNATWNMW